MHNTNPLNSVYVTHYVESGHPEPPRQGLHLPCLQNPVNPHQEILRHEGHRQGR